MPATWHRGRAVKSDYSEAIGSVSHIEGGTVWIVWPPSSEDARYSASGLSPKRIRPVGPEGEQLLLNG